MRELGATDEQINQQMAHFSASDDCEVLLENWPIVQWFLSVDDLFKFDGPVCLGLDVNAVYVDSKMTKRRIKKQHYEGLRVIGRAAAARLNERLEKG
jgi:hypothetical protein